MPINLPPPLPPTPAASALPPKTSRLAIASLVSSLVGVCGFTSLLGIIFGIVAITKINRSQGRLKGRGLAIAGICISCVMGVISLGFLAALMLPALAKGKMSSQRVRCINNMKQISAALHQYAEAHSDRFPPAASWCDDITPYLESTKVFVCSAHRGKIDCSYALNAAVAGQTVSSLNPQLVLLFETEDGWNATAGPETMVSHHYGGYNVGMLDGSVKQVTTEAIERLSNPAVP